MTSIIMGPVACALKPTCVALMLTKLIGLTHAANCQPHVSLEPMHFALQ